MKTFFKVNLARLNADFAETVGSSFANFFCPVLYKDEETELCQGHIINAAFDGSSRTCTVQRRDVDNFFGSRFESDFVDIAKFKKISLTEILADPFLSRRYRSDVGVNNESRALVAFQDAGLPIRLYHLRLFCRTNNTW